MLILGAVDSYDGNGFMIHDHSSCFYAFLVLRPVESYSTMADSIEQIATRFRSWGLRTFATFQATKSIQEHSAFINIQHISM